MSKLRDGSMATDPRLARLTDFDERSKKYKIRSALSGKKPKNRQWRTGRVLDQGQEGACVGFALTHDLLAYPAEVKGLTAAFAKKLYWEAQRRDDWEGGSYPGAKPKYEGTSVLAGIQAVQALGYIREYRWAFGLDDLILGLGHAGPAILGLEWRKSMYEPHSCGFIHTDSKAVGGHCILAVGVNVTEEYVTLQNSWGPKWGRKGLCRISFPELEGLLKAEGEAVFPVGRRTKPRPP
jgi:hypothetical protein